MIKAMVTPLMAAAMLAAGIPSGASAQDKVAPTALSTEGLFKRFGEEKTSFGQFRFLAGPDVQGNPALKGIAGQMLATTYSFLGRPNDAIREYPIHDRGKAPPGLPDEAGFVAKPAVDWIVEQTDRYQVVMVNEAHHRPQTRLLTLALLSRLHRLGFTYFAAEAFDDQPLKAGYPTNDTGYYTREPVFAEIVREAHRLGYVLVPYEASEDEADASQQARETGQAKHIAEVLARDPEARILVHAGYGHIGESAGSQPSDADPMALEFTRLTGLSVLSVDQTRLTWEDGRAADRLAREFAIDSPSVLLDRKTGSAWSAFPGRFDVSVVLPAATGSALRPDWLGLGGTRRAVAVGLTPCIGRLPCLVEARYAGEGDDAIPADQFVVLDDGEANTPLYLAPGRYRLRLLGNDGAPLAQRELAVAAAPGNAPSTEAIQ